MVVENAIAVGPSRTSYDPGGSGSRIARILDRLSRPWSNSAALLLAVVVALFSSSVAAQRGLPPPHTDIDQVWFAARAFLNGANPYDVVGPGRAFDFNFELYYPLPAILILSPIAFFPVTVSRVVVGALPGGFLAYLLARRDPRALVLFLSSAYYLNVRYAQWTPLLMCALYVPAFATFAVAKPSIGAAMIVGFRDARSFRTGMVAAAAMVVGSLLLWPAWPAAWLPAVRTAQHLHSFVLLPGGFLLLLALARWRRWEARLFAMLAIVPQTLHPIAVLPLMVLPRTFKERAALALLSYLPSFLFVREPWGSRIATASFSEATAVLGQLILWTVCLPALVMVLRLPNEGSAPAWLENLAQRWPPWLRGRPSDLA